MLRLDVRSGSTTDLIDLKSDFRFTSENGLNSDIAGGPFRANIGSRRALRSSHITTTEQTLLDWQNCAGPASLLHGEAERATSAKGY
jgi:hypothetical protein